MPEGDDKGLVARPEASGEGEEAGEAFGLQRFTAFIEAYQVFVEVVEAGKLGGARFTAYSS